MNLKTKIKCNILEYGYADKSVITLENVFVKVSWTGRKITLIGLDDDFYKKTIPIEASATVIVLQNGIIISHIN